MVSIKGIDRPLTNLRASVGFCTSSPHQGVRYQLPFLEVDSNNISCKILNDKVLVHLECKSKVFPGSANSRKCLGGILHIRVSDINYGIVGGLGECSPEIFLKCLNVDSRCSICIYSNVIVI